MFVSVIDPGVGTDRKSVVLKTRSGHYFVSPDNGTLTLVAQDLGIEGVREIDESRYRRPGSEQSYTFHGRDVYSYTAAHLASGQTSFEDIGPELPAEVVMIDYQKPEIRGDMVAGNIPILDVQYGNVWTNIDRATFEQLGVEKGTEMDVKIFNGEDLVFEGAMPYVSTFGDVPQGEPLLYMNSVDNLSAAINWGDFAATHGVGSGPGLADRGGEALKDASRPATRRQKVAKGRARGLDGGRLATTRHRGDSRMVAITPNAGNHAGLGEKASRYVNVFDLPWEKTKFPGVEAKTLLLDKETGLLTALIRMAPGARLPDHEHVLIEQTFMIEGTLLDEEGACTAGNFVWRPPGSRHEARTPNGGLMLAMFLVPNKFFDEGGSVTDVLNQDWQKAWGRSGHLKVVE